MKLLHCDRCNDVVALHREPRSCLCGNASGHYTDKNFAEFTGGYLLGIRNDAFLKARYTRSKKDNIPLFFIEFPPS